jgi:UDP-N-acetylmuramoyl-L-alanyl-D-glutamate--2,6-diaminopimelate ligase
MKLTELIAAARVPAEVDADAEIVGLAYDSRTVRPGDLFCCIPGRTSDGHAFAADAVAAGAAAVLVERGIGVAAPSARVGNVREALGPIAAVFFGRPSEALAVAGVTGTNGKTTVTYLVEAMASAGGLTPGVIGTVESRVAGEAVPAVRTTPESIDLQRLLARMRERRADVVAMEVTSHALHQHRVDGTRFACAAFTNLTQDHLDYHGTLDDYFAAKALLFDGRFTDRAVVNVDDSYGRRLVDVARGLDVVTCGRSGSVACEAVHMSTGGTKMRVRTPGGTIDISTPLVGRYNVDNVLCATGIATVLGIPPDAVARGAADVRVPGRLERIDAGQAFAVLVDYAHTPDALGNASAAARELASGRLIVVFGCGGDRDRGKRPLMGSAATSAADLTIVTSDNPRSEDPLAIIRDIEAGCSRGRYVVTPDRRAAIEQAIAGAGAGDVVLIAGKGHETGQQFADRTIPFDDRVVAREALERTKCLS